MLVLGLVCIIVHWAKDRAVLCVGFGLRMGYG